MKRLRELAAYVDGEVDGDGEVEIEGVASIEDAAPGAITFIASPKYLHLLATTKATALIVPMEDEMRQDIERGLNLLRVANPYLAFAKILALFQPPPSHYEGVHPRAEVHGGAVVGRGVSIYPFAVVDEGACIGDRVVLYPGVYVGRNAVVGDDTLLYPNVTVREGCRIGQRVIVHANSVVGSDGFGYARDGSSHHKIPQTGIVVLEDDVEIGAGVTIDRATLGETIIRRGTKVDNIVQIAHNVEIGEDSIIVAQVGISGSTKIGKGVTLAGQVGIAGHIEVGDGITVGAKAGVIGNLLEKGVFTGMPAMPHAQWLRVQGSLTKLPDMRKRLLKLERRLEEMESERGKAG
ncbi:MAG: UDP-3-O-(3-hydroxymyristoyl)glucosamine N-acyltransferase [Deltaproteobacteria bacterium]|nr:UDP-3-O-(3-hydroxymyristoyl)glucosamine N-acyltransferase [Deltaproteobacteria bacterium]